MAQRRQAAGRKKRKGRSAKRRTLQPADAEEESEEESLSDFRELTAGEVVECAVQSLVAAQEKGRVKEPLEHFWLAPVQREVLIAVEGMPDAVKKKLNSKAIDYSAAEVAGMMLTLAEELPNAEETKQRRLKLIAVHLMERLEHGVAIGGAGRERPEGGEEDAETRGEEDADGGEAGEEDAETRGEDEDGRQTEN